YEPEARIVSSFDKKPFNFKDNFKDKKTKAYNTFVDNTSYIGKTAGEKGNIATTTARLSAGTVKNSLENGLVNMEGKKVIDRGLQEVFNLPKEEQQALDELLFHQHNIDRIKQKKPVFGFNDTTANSQQIVNAIKKQYPHLEESAKVVTDTLKSLLDEWGVKSGLVAPELRDYLQTMYKNYVPTYRKLGGADAIMTKSRGMSVAKIINNAVGGDKDLITLRESIPMLIDKTIRAAKKNEVYQTILDIARKQPGNPYAQLLEATDKIDKVLEQKQIQSMLDSVKADGLEAISSFADKALEADPIQGYMLTVMEKGKPVKLKITKELFDSLKSLDKVDDTALNQALQLWKKGFTNPFKALVTGYNPLFAVKNVVRDIPTAYIQGTENNPFKFAKNLYDAGKDMATNAERFQEYKALGGEGGNFFNVEKGLKPKGWYEKPLKAIGALNNATETLPRYAEYIGTLKRGGTDYANKMKGMYNAQEVTTNFSRHGDLTKAVDAVVPYLNPAFQGMDKFIRSMGKPKNVAKAVGVTTVPTATLYAINQAVDKEGYDQLDNRTKDNYFLISKKLFGGKSGEFIKLPKTREAGVLFGALFERLARLAQGQEDSFKGFAGNAAQNMLPNNPFTSNQAYPLYQAFFTENGKDWAGRDIVPSALKDYSPKYQYDAQTSEIAKAIGDKFNISPKKLDYLAKSWLGIISQAGLPLATKSNYSNGRGKILGVLTAPFTADALYNNDIQNDFYNNIEKVNTQNKDAKLLGIEGVPNLLSGLNKSSGDMATIRNLMKQVEADPNLNNVQKQNKLRDYQQQILNIAQRNNSLVKNNDNSVSAKYPELTGTYYPESSFTVNKQKINLVPEEYTQYQQIADNRFKQISSNMRLDKNFDSYTDDVKEKMIKKMLDDANDYAKNQILNQRLLKRGNVYN
ncbi:MAG: LPD38 domain-containing protein, partial [Deltaproteobacteria bacterium]